ncbi:MAG: acetyl-CoA carboxylase biotin carboxylase subunit [Hyphomicrobiales bacterium]
MVRRLLIANRGEIALRIIRACHDLGVEAVVAYSSADEDSLPVRLADRAVCIGPAPAKRSYLDQAAIIAAAKGTGSDAIHPGYGFLSENAAFSRLCRDSGIRFVGPSAESIRLAGDKVTARDTLMAAGVPVVPGSDGALTDAKQAVEVAGKIGMPVLLKARAGGGGRGMRIVESRDTLATAWSEASGEALAAFGDPGMYMERYLRAIRHVEVQIIADSHGNTVALGERDCTVQRRHQKLVEEGPSPALDEKLRTEISAAAVKAAKAVDYEGAGTVEFIFDVERREFYFIEINARIQVEHPVTEMLTGIDLVAEQIRIASGERLSFGEKDVKLVGHAIECRINAEDPARNFAPSPGRIVRFTSPGGPGVRMDSHCYEGYDFPPFYDSLLGKLIVHGRDRDEAIRRCRRALAELTIDGVATTAPFHQAVLGHPDFLSGDITTAFVDKHLEQLNEAAARAARPDGPAIKLAS